MVVLEKKTELWKEMFGNQTGLSSKDYQEKTTIIKTALKPRKEKDAYHFLDRPG